MVIFMTGIVCADPGVFAVPETQTISTTTSGDVIGLVMETDAVTWTISNGTQIYKSWAEMVDTDGVQYTTAYDASIVAQGGHAAFTKNTAVDTRNKVTSQSNIKTQTGLTFAATEDGGNVVGSENLMLDGVGDSTPAADKVLCPFAAHNSLYSTLL